MPKITHFRGFLGNGAWLVFVHTKKCTRQRKNTSRAKREREILPNQQNQFTVAMRERAA